MNLTDTVTVTGRLSLALASLKLAELGLLSFSSVEGFTAGLHGPATGSYGGAYTVSICCVGPLSDDSATSLKVPVSSFVVQVGRPPKGGALSASAGEFSVYQHNQPLAA